MTLSLLCSALLRASLITRETALEAERRQGLYGGGLDTVLLEMGAVDEPVLAAQMGAFFGLKPLPMERLASQDLQARSWLDVGTAQRLGVAPIGRRQDALELAVRPDSDHDALVAWAGERALLVEPYLVTEVRFRVLLGQLYGIPVSPRFVSLLGKLVGPAEARRWLRPAVADEGAGRQAGLGSRSAVDRVEALLQMARLGDEDVRRVAQKALSRHLRDQRVASYASDLQDRAAKGESAAAVAAMASLAQLRDPASISTLMHGLEAEDPAMAEAAHAALVTLACEDLGRKRRRWDEWWERMHFRPRVEWLLDALGSREPESRLAASKELHDLTGEYFGYHYDLPERDREEARRRWQQWWATVGKRRLAGL